MNPGQRYFAESDKIKSRFTLLVDGVEHEGHMDSEGRLNFTPDKTLCALFDSGGLDLDKLAIAASRDKTVSREMYLFRGSDISIVRHHSQIPLQMSADTYKNSGISNLRTSAKSADENEAEAI
jgi:hypothetical protein